MSKSARPLDNINVSSPCTADWDSMVGNESVRFCEHCNHSVHNISEMRASDALRLVRNSKGRLCVRYVRLDSGAIGTLPSHPRPYSIKRRVSRIAAGAFGAALSLSASGAQGRPLSPVNEPLTNDYEWVLKGQAVSDNLGVMTELVGTVQDPQGAVIPGATITLINDTTKEEYKATSNDEGEYRFSSVPAGTHTLIVESPGFRRYELRNIALSVAGEHRINVSLEISGVTMGIVLIAAPTEPLVKAALDEDVDAIAELLRSGADTDVVDKNYDATALGVAVGRGNHQIVRMLLKAGADPNKVNSKGQTALMNLGVGSTASIVKDLLASRANIDALDEDGESALMVAARINHVDVLRLLLSQGARVNERNEAGQTALMLAAKEGYIENVKALIEGLADVNMMDDDDWTALRYARDNEHEDIVELLKSYGAVE
jgi:hypothetical protein